MTEVDLMGVPETMLWPLWNRAEEASRRDRLIEDPWSILLVEEIDYDFQKSFGSPTRHHGVRARVGDDLVTDFLNKHRKNACVVALGEGLESQYWRLGKPNVPWLSVDLPEAIDVRKRLLPEEGSITYVPYSAFDDRWMDCVPKDRIPFISAMGLFMYFQETDVVDLLTRIGQRFPDAEIYFDTIPEWLSKKSLAGFNVTKHYQAPPMPWGISVEDLSKFLNKIPGIEPVQIQTYADPYPAALELYYYLSKIRFLRRILAPSLVRATASGPAQAQ